MGRLAIAGGTPVRTKPFSPWPVYDEREEKALIETLRSREWGIGSQQIEDFENEFAAFCGAQHAVTCTNGTDAIYIALQALGVGPGDEVIIPPYTFIATGIGVLMTGAIPVFADIDPDTYNLDPKSVENKITENTKAIIPVHIAGNPADMDGILDLAKRKNLYVMEDAAQSHAAEWRGQRVGPIGDLGTFSFQNSKNLSSGEGGAIVTNDEALAERVRSFVNCGRVKGGLWYDHHELAGNHRLGAFQAAVLRVGLTRLDEQTKRREENAEHLQSLLEDIDGIDMTKKYEHATRRAHHLGILRYNQQAFKDLPKAKFIEAMEKEGIECASGYLPLYNYYYFQHFAEKTPGYETLYKGKVDYSAVECPVVERICKEESVWLFQETFLGYKSDMDDIAEAIKKILQYADEAKV